jgi:hypothetical protein
MRVTPPGFRIREVVYLFYKDFAPPGLPRIIICIFIQLFNYSVIQHSPQPRLTTLNHA